MDLNHIQLNTTDVEAAVGFYQKHFDFKVRKQHGDGVFLWNESGFMMAINPLETMPVFPSWFHIGFRLKSGGQVRLHRERLMASGYEVGDLQAYDDYVVFRCKDPSGYGVEVFWEQLPAGVAG